MKFRSLGIAVLLWTLMPAHLPAQQSETQRDYATAQRTLASGDVDGALRIFERLSSANPEIAELHATIGAIHYQQGDYPGARP